MWILIILIAILIVIFNTILAITLLNNYCLLERKDLVVFIPPVAIIKFLTIKPL